MDIQAFLTKHKGEFQSLARQVSKGFKVPYDELIQNASISLWKSPPRKSFETPEDRQRFLRRVLMNKAIHMKEAANAKKRKMKPQKMSHEGEFDVAALSHPGNLLPELKELFNKLEPYDRNVLLAYLSHRNKAEVARQVEPGRFTTPTSQRVHGGRMVKVATSRLKALIDQTHQPRRKPRRHA